MGDVWSPFLFTPVSLPFIPKTSVEVNLIFVLAINLVQCKPARDELVFMLLLPASCVQQSLRRKTCVLSQSDGVFLMAHRPWTNKLDFLFFAVALLPVFFYTQQVLFC